MFVGGYPNEMLILMEIDNGGVATVSLISLTFYLVPDKFLYICSGIHSTIICWICILRKR